MNYKSDVIQQINNKKWEVIRSKYTKLITVRLGYDENYNVIDNTPHNIYENIDKIELNKIKRRVKYVIERYLIKLDNIEKICGGIGYYNKKDFIIKIDETVLELIIIPDKNWISYIGVYINNEV